VETDKRVALFVFFYTKVVHKTMPDPENVDLLQLMKNEPERSFLYENHRTFLLRISILDIIDEYYTDKTNTRR